MNHKNIDKAKVILETKSFCFTKMQEKTEIENGREVMNVEDILFLLGLRISKPRLLTVDMTNYDSDQLFLGIEKAKGENLDGLSLLISPISNDDVKKVSSMGYRVEFLGPGDCGDEIYFTDHALLLNRICDFQFMFGEYSSFVESGTV